MDDHRLDQADSKSDSVRLFSIGPSQYKVNIWPCQCNKIVNRPHLVQIQIVPPWYVILFLIKD